MSLLQCACTKSRTLESSSSVPYREKSAALDTRKDTTNFGSRDSRDHSLEDVATFEPSSSAYELYTVIGKGFGDAATVHLGKHIPSDRNVAIKRTNIELSQLEIGVLHDEAVLSRQLHNDKVLQFYTTFVHNNEIWTVMPLMAYGSSKDLMLAYFTTGLPEQAIAYILRDVLLALEYLHTNGIIHRAVKASHILIAANGRVCLSGLRNVQSMVHHGKKKRKVHKYPEQGTSNLQWLSPEDLEQNLSGYDTRSDLYSLGVTACELANGYAPFTDMPVTQMLLEKVNGTKPVLADCTTIAELIGEENAGVQDSGQGTEMVNNLYKSETIEIASQRKFSNSFHNFVDICLEKDPEHRQSVASLLNHSFFKHLKKRATEALPGLLQPLSPLGDVSKLMKAEPEVDNAIESVENMTIDEGWDF